VATHADIGAALDRLVVAAHRQRAAAAAAATLPDLNATDLLALTVVYHARIITPGALADAMHLTPGGVVAVVRRVTDAEVIGRTTLRRDHRDTTLAVTERGASLMTTGVGAWDPQLLEQVAGLHEPDKLMDLLRSIAEAAEQRATALASDSVEVRRRVRETPRPVLWG
jgi:DNA-binding MarR family transcriptional regulator